MAEAPMWDIIALELSGDNPLAAREIVDSCTATEIAIAWQNNRRKQEGVGFKIKE